MPGAGPAPPAIKRRPVKGGRRDRSNSRSGLLRIDERVEEADGWSVMQAVLRQLERFGASAQALAALQALPTDSRILRPDGLVRTIKSRSPFTHFIDDGWAARCEHLPDGSRQITNFLLPGDFCDLHCEALGRMDHEVVALTRLRLGAFHTSELLELESEHPNLARAFWRMSLTEAAVFRAWIANIGQREAETRVAHLLCELQIRLKQAGLVGDHSFSMPLTQEDLSEATGITAVHMNRILQRLRAKELIRLEGRVLTLLDPEGLASLAGFDPLYLHVEAA